MIQKLDLRYSVKSQQEEKTSSKAVTSVMPLIDASQNPTADKQRDVEVLFMKREDGAAEMRGMETKKTS